MPEIITKHPDIVLKLLQDAGAKCDTGDAKILTHCPKEQFCSFKNGEICVYGINNITSMTQISSVDIAEMTQNIPTMFSVWNIILLGIVCLFGLFFGMWLKK